MTTSNHFSFANKVWISSVLLSPFLISIGMSIFGMINPQDVTEIASFMIPYGFLFSIPNWIILILATWLVNKLTIPIIEKKVILAIISIVLTVILFSIVFGGKLGELWWVEIGYLLTVTFGIVIFKLIPPSPDSQKKEIINVKLLDDILDDENY